MILNMFDKTLKLVFKYFKKEKFFEYMFIVNIGNHSRVHISIYAEKLLGAIL